MITPTKEEIEKLFGFCFDDDGLMQLDINNIKRIAKLAIKKALKEELSQSELWEYAHGGNN